MDINHIRKAYRLKMLNSDDMRENPIIMFREWFHEALNSKIDEVNAAALATANLAGRPSCRMILLKHIEDDGLLFFTNYESPKADDLSENPYAAITVWWKELERQVRFVGRVEKCSREVSIEYFAKRPRKSQLAAWASEQSKPIGSRSELEKEYKVQEQRFEGQLVTAPEFWGGYRLIPDEIEFWQGRENRMHDRFLYKKAEHGWSVGRLSP